METVERHVTLPASADEVWELLTRPEELRTWLGDEVVLDPTPGSPGRVVERDRPGRALVVEEVEAGQRLAWRWWVDGEDPSTASRVEITLDPTEGGTLLRVVEERLPSTTSARAQAGAAWSHRLLHLEALLLVAAAVRG